MVGAGRAGPPVPSILREGVSEGQVKHLLEECTPLLNKALAVAYRLATGKDFALTVQACATARPVLSAVSPVRNLSVQ